MKAKFVVCVGNDIPPEHPTFEAAFAVFFERVKALVGEGASWQVIETACWIEGIFESEITGKVSRAPLYFYDAKDFAYNVGILIESSDRHAILANPLPSIPLEKVIDVYTEASLQELSAVVDMEFERALSMSQLAAE